MPSHHSPAHVRHAARHFRAYRRSASGRLLDALLHKPLGLIDEIHNYRKMSKQEVVNIRNQVNVQVKNRIAMTKDLYQEEVKVVIKDGKIFYLTA